MAGKVVKKTNISAKKTKLTGASKSSSPSKKGAVKPAVAKGKSKVVSSTLKKAAAQSAKSASSRVKAAKKTEVVKPGLAKKNDIKAKRPVSSGKVAKTVKAQPVTGKSKLKQVAKQLASAAEVKAQKKKEITQKVAVAKAKVKELKAKRADEETELAQKVSKKLPTPEPIIDDILKAPAIDANVPPILTDAEGRPYCKVKDCDQIATVDGYCRYHYLLLWKKIQVRRKILIDGKLERYVEELTARYPDKFLEVIRKDLLNEKNFLAAIAELEIDESSNDSDFEEEDTQAIEEVRSFSDSSIIGDDDF